MLSWRMTRASARSSTFRIRALAGAPPGIIGSLGRTVLGFGGRLVVERDSADFALSRDAREEPDARLRTRRSPACSMCGSWSTSTWPVARIAFLKPWRLRSSSAFEKLRPSLKAGKASATSDRSSSRGTIFSTGSAGSSRTPSLSRAEWRCSGSRSRKACSGRMKRRIAGQRLGAFGMPPFVLAETLRGP